MYQDFCTKHPDVTISYVYYYKKVKSLNITFVKLGGEECEKCDLHEKYLEDCHRLVVQPVTLLKLTLLHECFPFLNCTNGTKSRNASHILNRGIHLCPRTARIA